MRKLLRDVSSLCGKLNVKGPVWVLCDNQAALTLCQDPKETQRIKHVGIIHYFARAIGWLAGGSYCRTFGGQCFRLPHKSVATCY